MQNKEEEIKTLLEQNDELENYFQNTIIPQLFVDAQLVLRKFTPPAMKQFKLKKDYIGKRMTDIQENFRFPTIIENIQYVIESGAILEKEIQTTDMRWYQMNIIPYLIRRERKTNGVIITFVDITSRIRDLHEQEKMIAEHELLLDTIAHDIKNPLTALGMSIGMLKKLPEKGMERFPQLLQHVEASLLKMNAVISELVQARWQGPRYQATEELLDLQNILEDVRLTLSQQIEASRAVIHADLGISEVRFVRRKLRSVLYNLLSNAIKYTSPGRPPEISIRSRAENDYIVVTIADNGIGIGKEDQNTIFDKFERLSDTIEGNGVGLYLVKQILESACCRITVESEPGKGSVFSIYLRGQGQ